MRTRLFLTLIGAALFLSQPASAQFGSLKGLGKAAKQKVTNVAKDKARETQSGTVSVPATQQQTTNYVGNPAGEATETVTTTAATPSQRPPLVWPMSGGAYKDMDMRSFLFGIVNAGVSDEELATMRDQCFARYRSNVPIYSNYESGSDQARAENQNFLRFLYEMRTIVTMNISNVRVSSDGGIDGSNAYYLVTKDGGVGIGVFATQKDGRFQFVLKDGTGIYLNAEELATAQKAAQRMRKFQQLTYGLKDFLKEDPSKYDVNLAVMYNLCGMYANAVEKACEYNKPENIERKPRPAGGALHASMKAKALAVAKADDPEVVDVIITSGKWDVKTNAFGIPVNRNIYGYYIYKDEVGLQCCPRMWSEDYQGGKYGSLRKGGVGVGSPFYIK